MNLPDLNISFTTETNEDLRDFIQQWKRHCDSVTKITGIKIRKPLDYEHPLTFDVRFGTSSKETMQQALTIWQQASTNIGPIYMRRLTAEQQFLVDTFWSYFDPSCIVKHHDTPNGENPVVVKLSYDSNIPAIDEQKKLEDPSNFDAWWEH